MTQKVKISTDSTADIPKELCEKLNISVLPLSIIVGDKEYLDNVDITPTEFYEILENAPTIPTTSQVAIERYDELFTKALEEGYTDLVHVTINAKGSGTYQAGVLARSIFYEQHPEAQGKLNIRIIDSKTYSMGYGMAVCEGAELAQKGEDAEKVAAHIEDWLEHSRVLFVPFNLKYVKKSGRVSAAAAFVGDAIGLKPIITFIDGGSEVIAKVRGDNKAIAEVLNICNEERRKGTNYVLVRGSNPGAFAKLKELAAETFEMEEYTETDIGSVISINSGHNMVGLIYRT